MTVQKRHTFEMKRGLFFFFIRIFLQGAVFFVAGTLVPGTLCAQEDFAPAGQEIVSDSGGLELTSKPSGAVVYIDGYEEGITRLVIPDVPAGQYSVIFQSGETELSGIFNVYKDETLKLRADFNRGEIINITEEQIRIRDEVADNIIRVIERSGCRCLREFYDYNYMDNVDRVLEGWNSRSKTAGIVDCEQFDRNGRGKIQCGAKVRFYYFDTDSKMTCSVSKEIYDAKGIKKDSMRFLSPLYTIDEELR